MTTRLTMIAALLLMLAAQVWGLVTVWQDEPLRSLASAGKKEAKAQAATQPEGRLSLQPALPPAPPDLNQGFLFNAERSLVPGGGKEGQSQNAGNVGMDKIHYNGSIIAGNTTRALLSYSALGGIPPSPGGTSAAPQKQRFLRVVVGDTVDGYKVTEILPGKITFSRSGQQISKPLYDRTKERAQAQPSPPPVREPGVQAPPPSPPPSQATRQDAPPQPLAPRQLQPPPGNEAPGKIPLPNRPEQAKDPNAPNARDVFKMLIEKQQQRNQALGRGGKNEGQ